MHNEEISKRAFGKTGVQVTCVGLGGEGILRTYGQNDAAEAVIREAVKGGITYFDSANAYAGSEGYYGLIWPKQPEHRERSFQASKSAQRDRQGALSDLDRTLNRMGIKHLDLWQIHDVRTHQDLDRIAAPGGALEAFITARSSGKARFIGVTGHHDPEVLTRAVKEWPVDAVMMPINPVEANLGGFMDTTLPAARQRGIAVIGMKILGASHYLSSEAGITADLLIRFALSHPLSVAIVGCSNRKEVQTLAAAGRDRQPLDNEQIRQMTEIFRPYSKRLAYYRGVL
ncbi:MAG: aldo/keto reductase [Desulforhabdus sp.]|nr:aldo/keto reductase [Desulforhabdus sp.]